MANEPITIKKGTAVARGEPAVQASPVPNSVRVFSIKKSTDGSKISIDKILLNDKLNNSIKDRLISLLVKYEDCFAF